MDRCVVQDITVITLNKRAVQHRCHNIHQFYLLLFRGVWLPGYNINSSSMTGGQKNLTLGGKSARPSRRWCAVFLLFVCFQAGGQPVYPICRRLQSTWNSITELIGDHEEPTGLIPIIGFLALSYYSQQHFNLVKIEVAALETPQPTSSNGIQTKV